MENLAGQPHAPVAVREEMAKAGIEPKAHYLHTGKGEVPADVGGVVHSCYFTRAWSYWTVVCHMPMHLAREMYYENGKIGRYQIRVAGHCGCPPPEHYSERDAIGSYHIDTIEGLTLFVHYAKLAEEWMNIRRHVPYEVHKALEKQQTVKEGNRMCRELIEAGRKIQSAFYNLDELLKDYGKQYPWPNQDMKDEIEFQANASFECCLRIFEMAKDERITSLSLPDHE